MVTIPSRINPVTGSPDIEQQVQMQSNSNLVLMQIDLNSMLQAMIASFSVILISELGDKTFIITAIMSMKNSRSLTFIASGAALSLMTILSVVLGVAVTVIPTMYTHYASIVLFIYFGLKMFQEAFTTTEDKEEFDEVERSLVKDDPDNIEVASNEAKKIKWISILSPFVIKVFTMVLVAEWGDRSQISTVVLAARNDALGVLIGALAGHLLCTGLAVIGGRFVADIISVRTSK